MYDGRICSKIPLPTASSGNAMPVGSFSLSAYRLEGVSHGERLNTLL